MKQDRDRVWEGSPWHVSNNAVILSEFDECMKPSELKFDRLTMWARIMNLPFNLRDKKWWLPLARQIDARASVAQFDHVGGYLRVRVTVEVTNPLRRWILIDSARRKCVDMYEIQYEQVPHFCFSCGRIGHADPLCPTPGTRGTNGELPFGKTLRAPSERRRTAYSEGSSSEKGFTKNSKADTRSSSTAADVGSDATSLLKKNSSYKRKAGTPSQVYRRVDMPLLTNSSEVEGENQTSLVPVENRTIVGEGTGGVHIPKKKKPTPPSSENSAAAASQPCLEQ